MSSTIFLNIFRIAQNPQNLWKNVTNFRIKTTARCILLPTSECFQRAMWRKENIFHWNINLMLIWYFVGNSCLNLLNIKLFEHCHFSHLQQICYQENSFKFAWWRICIKYYLSMDTALTLSKLAPFTSLKFSGPSVNNSRYKI